MLQVYPVVGTKYIVREWDDTVNKVKVVDVSKDNEEVTFEYEDGLIHTVSADYFAVGLNATGVR